MHNLQVTSFIVSFYNSYLSGGAASEEQEVRDPEAAVQTA